MGEFRGLSRLVSTDLGPHFLPQQSTDRLANITGPSSDKSGVPHRFRCALYANRREFRIQKFGSEGRPAREGASPEGARPCPQRVLGVVRNPHTLPYDINCKDQPVQGSWAVRSGAMRYVGELRVNGVLGSPPPASKCLDYEKDGPFG